MDTKDDGRQQDVEEQVWGYYIWIDGKGVAKERTEERGFSPGSV